MYIILVSKGVTNLITLLFIIKKNYDNEHFDKNDIIENAYIYELLLLNKYYEKLQVCTRRET